MGILREALMLSMVYKEWYAWGLCPAYSIDIGVLTLGSN